MSYEGELKFTTAGDFMKKQKQTFVVGQPRFYSNPQENIVRKEIWDDAESMNDDLVSYWNENVEKEDTVIVVGELLHIEGDSILQKLNGKIIFVKNKTDALTKYVDDKSVTTVNSLDLLFNNESIYITNYLEHINIIESNLIITSDSSVLVDKVNDKYVYYRDHKGVTRFINNLSIPIFNVNLELWTYTPVNIDTILKLYSEYRNHNTN